MYKGDILALNNGVSPVEVGEIVVFRIDNKDIPIVHRVLEHRFLEDGSEVFLTKGDNNVGDDRILYPQGQVWLKREQMVGRAVGFMPFCGHATILLNEYPAAKFGLIAIMLLYVLTSREG
jgi:signal peptidase